MMDKYASYADLKAAHVEGQDYRIVSKRRLRAKAIIVAPHGGSIEIRTSEIAEKIAGNEHSVYLFEGLMQKDNARLHVTSHNFDERRCLDLLPSHNMVLTIHGCANDGAPDAVYVGGAGLCALPY